MASKSSRCTRRKHRRSKAYSGHQMATRKQPRRRSCVRTGTSAHHEKTSLAKIAATVSLLLASSVANAQETPEECQPSQRDPIGCYVIRASQEFFLCRLEVQLALVQGTSDFSCIDKRQGPIAPLYNAAAKAAAKSPPTTSLLRDFHATFQSGMRGLAPSPSDSELRWKQRNEERSRLLDEKAARLRLERQK